MVWTFDSALADDLISVENRDDDMGLFEVRIGPLEAVVTIELGRFMTSENTKFFVSHAIKPPTLATPYRTSHQFADYPAYALHRAIAGLTSEYRVAVGAGHAPEEAWLVEGGNT